MRHFCWYPKIIAQSTLTLPDLLHGSVGIVGGGNYVSYFGGQAPAAARQILPTYTKITAAAAQVIHLETCPASTDAAQLQRVATLMRSGGLMSGPVSVQPMIFE